MTSREFIQDKFGVSSERNRQCSSVFADMSGNIYSYGYHYPLLFKVGGLVFRNTRGYSNTTAKHISWCSGFNAIDVELSGCNQYSWQNSENSAKVPKMLYERRYNGGATDKQILKAILNDLTEQDKTLATEMASKKRKDTAVYRNLQRQHDYVLNAYATVKGAL